MGFTFIDLDVLLDCLYRDCTFRRFFNFHHTHYAMSHHFIKFSGVHYRYADGTEALKGITFQINHGERVALLGLNGSGKSTLLRCATLLEKMDYGDLYYLGEAAARIEGNTSVYAKNAELEKIRQSFGLVFQNFNLFPHYTVLKNITDAPLHIQKRPKNEVLQEAAELLKKMGLEEKAHDYPHQLSGGQQQRVAIARALITKPAIILADEPTGNLDSKSTRAVIRSFEQAKSALEATIFMVTHDSYAASFCDRVVILRDGVVWKTLEKGATERETFQDQLLDAVREMGRE